MFFFFFWGQCFFAKKKKKKKIQKKLKCFFLIASLLRTSVWHLKATQKMASFPSICSSLPLTGKCGASSRGRGRPTPGRSSSWRGGTARGPCGAWRGRPWGGGRGRGSWRAGRWRTAGRTPARTCSGDLRGDKLRSLSTVKTNQH